MKFRSVIRQVCLFSLAAVVFSTAASAQQGGDGGGQPPQGGRGQRGGGGFGGGFGGGMFGGGRGGGMMAPRFDRARLLGIEQVRTELKIDDAQSAVIDAALDAYRDEQNNAQRPDREAVQNMSEEERTKLFTDMQKQRDELSKKTDDVLNALLEDSQKTRLDQISLQLRMTSGIAAFLKADDIKGQLKISDEQVAKLDEAEKASQAEMQKMFEEMRGSFGGGRPGGGGAPGAAPAPGAPGAGGPGGGFEAMREKMEAARKKTSDAAMAVLTDGQKKQLEDMQGAKFEIDMRAMMGGRGGFGGGPGGPGGPGGAPGQGGRGQRGQGGQGGQRGQGGRPQAE